MKSIQARLTCWLAITMVLLSAATGGGLFLYLHHALLKEFDDSLTLRGYALESLITQKSSGKYDIDVDPSVLPEYRRANFHEYFRITDATGKMLVTSTHEPVTIDGPTQQDVPQDIQMPRRTRARALTTQFVPQMEREDEPFDAAAAARPRPALTLLVARDRRPLDAALARVGVAIGAAVAALSLVTLVATVVIVRAALKTMRGLAGEMAEIDFTRPDARFVASEVPRELEPIVGRFNEMLCRIRATLSREKRFTADIAHELRTPIAELRSAAEVALRAPDDESAAQRTVTQARDIALQMQTVVTTLLAIVRGTPVAEMLTIVAVPLWPLVQRVVQRQPVRRGEVMLKCPSGVDLHVRADAALLRAVLDNVIGNAFDHAAAGGPVSITAVENEQAVRLLIENDDRALTPQDLSTLFDPFWRKDAARSVGHHVGLGLTLTRTYCDAMGIVVSASLPAAGRFRIELALPRAAPPLAPEPRPAEVTLSQSSY